MTRADLLPAESFLSATVPTHLIYILKEDGTRNILGCLPYDKEDTDNQGLPAWFFGLTEDNKLNGDDTFYSAIQNLGDGNLEWVPGMGPAPIWKARVDQFSNNEEMIAAFVKWLGETY